MPLIREESLNQKETQSVKERDVCNVSVVVRERLNKQPNTLVDAVIRLIQPYANDIDTEKLSNWLEQVSTYQYPCGYINKTFKNKFDNGDFKKVSKPTKEYINEQSFEESLRKKGFSIDRDELGLINFYEQEIFDTLRVTYSVEESIAKLREFNNKWSDYLRDNGMTNTKDIINVIERSSFVKRLAVDLEKARKELNEFEEEVNQLWQTN